MSSSNMSSDTFFASQPPPTWLEAELSTAREFIRLHAKEGQRVVLVTSGGTTVPLEHNVVRFLDNFSAGTRGAASAEHFLRTGHYAVVFLHRQHSLQPFSRHYSHSTNPFLDLLEVTGGLPSLHDQVKSQSRSELLKSNDGRLFPLLPPLPPTVHLASPRSSSINLPPSQPLARTRTENQSAISIPEPHLTPMLTLLRSYKTVRRLNLLHTMTFVTVNEYLWLLRGLAEIMGSEDTGLGRRGMFYLAAAVSDFFIPDDKISEHKIQSGKGLLQLEMYPVPKILSSLTSLWSRSSYTVSFKLETDPQLLIPKARAALEKYGHQLVIGNELNTRKEKVCLVEKGDDEQWIRLRGAPGENQEGKEIEEEIIRILDERHSRWAAAEGTMARNEAM